KDVEANVTVAVRVLTPDTLAHAAPIILTPTTPAHLTQGWTPQGGGGLGRVMEGVLRAVGDAAHTVQVVSMYPYGGQIHPDHPQPSSSTADLTHSRPRATTPTVHSACVWVSVKKERGDFMDPVKLKGLMALHSHQIEALTNLTVVRESSTVVR
ncbi:hypothetical protein OTU49_001796, partial [Cherax quadricarinatus]